MVSENLNNLLTYLRRNCVTNDYDTESNIECELIAYALDNIVDDTLYEK